MKINLFLWVTVDQNKNLSNRNQVNSPWQFVKCVIKIPHSTTQSCLHSSIVGSLFIKQLWNWNSTNRKSVQENSKYLTVKSDKRMRYLKLSCKNNDIFYHRVLYTFLAHYITSINFSFSKRHLYLVYFFRFALFVRQHIP